MAEHTIHEFRTNSRMRTRKFEHSWPIRERQITQTTKSVRISKFHQNEIAGGSPYFSLLVTKRRIFATTCDPFEPFCDCETVTINYDRRHDIVLAELQGNLCLNENIGSHSHSQYQ